MDYVLVYARAINRNFTDVLLVLKDRPPWQAGMLNLVGGKIEEGETPVEAALRELKEEAGLEGRRPVLMGKVTGSWGTCYCVRVSVWFEKAVPAEGETEEVTWAEWQELCNHERLIPNLRVVIPLMVTGIMDWVVFDEGPDWKSDTHEISIKLKSWIKESDDS